MREAREVAGEMRSGSGGGLCGAGGCAGAGAGSSGAGAGCLSGVLARERRRAR